MEKMTNWREKRERHLVGMGCWKNGVKLKQVFPSNNV